MNMQKSVIQGNNRANQAMLHSQMNRNILKSNMNVAPNTKPLEVIVENNNMQQTIYVNPNQNFQQELPQVQRPSIYKGYRPLIDSCSDVLEKKSPHFFQGWQKKFCKIENRRLTYYNNQNKSQLEGSLNFDLQNYTLKEEKNQQGQIVEFKLTPQGATKEFIFRCSTDSNTDRWAKLVRQHLESSKGYKQKLTLLSSIPKFWKHDQLSDQQVEDECNDGDIVLFRSKDIFSNAARTLLGSEYDHVAICYRDDRQLWVYEAVQSGVGTFRWGIQNSQIDYLKLQDWYKFYDKVCIRKLTYPKRENFEVKQKFQQFIEENMGNDYSLNIGKIFKFTSTIQTKKPVENNEEKKRSFFCSELVAKAYKELGILDQKKSSTQYHPNDFTAAKQLQLLEGATLSPEYLVLFES